MTASSSTNVNRSLFRLHAVTASIDCGTWPLIGLPPNKMCRIFHMFSHHSNRRLSIILADMLHAQQNSHDDLRRVFCWSTAKWTIHAVSGSKYGNNVPKNHSSIATSSTHNRKKPAHHAHCSIASCWLFQQEFGAFRCFPNRWRAAWGHSRSRPQWICTKRARIVLNKQIPRNRTTNRSHRAASKMTNTSIHNYTPITRG